MTELIQLATVFVSGCFGLVVAISTNLMINRKDSVQFRRQKSIDFYEEVKQLYTDHLSTLHLLTTYTVNHMNETPLLEDYSKLQNKLALISTPEIIEKSDLLIDTTQKWAREYNAGNPAGMVLAQGQQHRESAAALAKLIENHTVALTQAMRVHLNELRQF